MTLSGPQIPENITFTGISSNAVTPDDEILFFVEPANKPADPVILTVSTPLSSESLCKANVVIISFIRACVDTGRGAGSKAPRHAGRA